MYTKHSPRLWITAAMLALLSCAAAKGEMIILDAYRAIGGTATQQTEVLISSGGSGAFEEDVLRTTNVRNEAGDITGIVTVNSSQGSTISEDLIRGFGRGSAFGSGPGTGSGISELSVAFELTDDTRFNLVGELRLAHGLTLNGSSAYVRLIGPDGEPTAEVVMDEANPPTGVGVVSFDSVNQIQGELPAGMYRLEAFAEGIGSDGSSRCADFEFTFTAVSLAFVPEPSGFTLCMMGFVALLVARRR